MKLLIDSQLELRNKTILLRVDMNCPVKDGRILGSRRIVEAAENLEYLKESRAVVITHQGRVGNSEYVELDNHASILELECGRPVKYVRDVMGDAAIDAIKNMSDGDIILLDNLRFCAEENFDYDVGMESNSMLVQRLSPYLNACILDAFPCAHRRHPSITGFARAGIPAYAGVITGREINNLSKIMSVSKGQHVVVLGGSKIEDRLYAIDRLLSGGKADHILLTGLPGCLFLYAQARLNLPTLDDRITSKDLIRKAHSLMDKYPGKVHTPVDVAIDVDGRRVDIDVQYVSGINNDGDASTTEVKNTKICDIGSNTAEYYSKWISSAGTVFMSGPAGWFEREKFALGTNALLKAMADSAAITIVSGGHLTTALADMDLTDKINHVSTAGGALVSYITGKTLPMIEVLNLEKQKEYPDEIRCASCGRNDPFVEQMRVCAKCSRKVCSRDMCLSIIGRGLCNNCLND